MDFYMDSIDQFAFFNKLVQDILLSDRMSGNQKQNRNCELYANSGRLQYINSIQSLVDSKEEYRTFTFENISIDFIVKNDNIVDCQWHGVVKSG